MQEDDPFAIEEAHTLTEEFLAKQIARGTPTPELAAVSIAGYYAIATARAERHKTSHHETRAAIVQAEAEIGRAEATLSFRQKQYERIQSLFELKSIDGRRRLSP